MLIYSLIFSINGTGKENSSSVRKMFKREPGSVFTCVQEICVQYQMCSGENGFWYQKYSGEKWGQYQTCLGENGVQYQTCSGEIRVPLNYTKAFTTLHQVHNTLMSLSKLRARSAA